MAAPAQRATPRGKWRWAAAAAVAGSAIVAAIFLWPWGGAENDKGVQQAPPPKAIAMRLDLRVWRKGDLTRVLKLADPGTLPLRPGDRVSVEASADRPVYFYVLYLEAKGAVAPMYPWRNYDWNDRPTEQKRGQLFVPDDPDKNAAPLTSGPSGIESYLLLARDEPLSPEDNERLADCFTNLIKQNAPDLRGAVWLTRAGREFSQEADRGRPDQAQAVAPTDPLEQVRRLLAGPLATLADDARAVCFSFKGD